MKRNVLKDSNRWFWRQGFYFNAMPRNIRNEIFEWTQKKNKKRITSIYQIGNEESKRKGEGIPPDPENPKNEQNPELFLRHKFFNTTTNKYSVFRSYGAILRLDGVFLASYLSSFRQFQFFQFPFNGDSFASVWCLQEEDNVPRLSRILSR